MIVVRVHIIGDMALYLPTRRNQLVPPVDEVSNQECLNFYINPPACILVPDKGDGSCSPATKQVDELFSIPTTTDKTVFLKSCNWRLYIYTHATFSTTLQ